MNCDWIAPIYAFGERVCFLGALEKRREEYLLRLRYARRAIVFGDGDGRFTAALLRSNKAVKVAYVDKSKGMMEQAWKRISRLGREALQRVEFCCSDALDCFPGEPCFDLVVTHFFLDCLSDQEVMDFTRNISQGAAPGALWIVSEFRRAEDGWARIWTGVIIRGLYGLFRLTTGLRITEVPDYSRIFRLNGFARTARRTALQGLLVSELWEMRGKQDFEEGNTHTEDEYGADSNAETRRTGGQIESHHSSRDRTTETLISVKSETTRSAPASSRQSFL